MKCTDCFQNVNPVIVSDVDGTQAIYHQHLADFARSYWGAGTFVCEWDGVGEFEDYLNLSKAEYREAKLAFRQGGMKRTMPAYIDMMQFLGELQKNGDIDLWVVTNRPWQRLDNVDPDTRFWLEKMGVKYDGLLFGDDKYGDLVKIVDPDRIIGVIDDLPEQYDRAWELGLPVWQVARIHNAGLGQERPRRATVAAIKANVKSFYDDWVEVHKKEDDRSGI